MGPMRLTSSAKRPAPQRDRSGHRADQVFDNVWVLGRRTVVYILQTSSGLLTSDSLVPRSRHAALAGFQNSP